MKRLFLFLIFLVSLSIVVFHLSRARSFQFFGDIYTRSNTSSKVVALTFDDGPNEKVDTVLAILKQLQIKATFYLDGYSIYTHQSETKKIVLDNHEIGNHSYSHKRMIFKTYGFITEEIEKTDSLIRAAGYDGEITFRPPYAKKLFLLPLYLYRNHRKTIMWDIEPESYPEISISSNKIKEYVLKNTSPGSIILLHVLKNDSISIHSISKIVTALKRKGYSFKTVSELLKLNAGA